jgi:diaminobutyrate-2-oxoglutarate transaminase
LLYILLIVDDIQVGCGRTGPFFSFEEAGIRPDMVCLSKSISGYGLPMAMTLLRPEIDVWEPGEHNGTFRGNGMAFVTATAALETYWRDQDLEKQTVARGHYVRSRLDDLANSFPPGTVRTRGRGLVNGIAFEVPELAQEVCDEAFRRGLVMETSGSDNEVVKLMPPLTITDQDLAEGLEVLGAAVRAVLGSA